MEEIKRLQAVLAQLDPVKDDMAYGQVLGRLHSLAHLQKKLLKNDRIYMNNAKLAVWLDGEPDHDRKTNPAVNTDDPLPTAVLQEIMSESEPNAESETAEPVEAEEAAEQEEAEQPVQENVTVEEPAETVKLPTMTEVRGALAAARRKGVNVTTIIQSFGVDNFKDIPKEKYPEILQKLEG